MYFLLNVFFSTHLSVSSYWQVAVWEKPWSQVDLEMIAAPPHSGWEPQVSSSALTISLSRLNGNFILPVAQAKTVGSTLTFSHPVHKQILSLTSKIYPVSGHFSSHLDFCPTPLKGLGADPHFPSDLTPCSWYNSHTSLNTSGTPLPRAFAPSAPSAWVLSSRRQSGTIPHQLRLSSNLIFPVRLPLTTPIIKPSLCPWCLLF